MVRNVAVILANHHLLGRARIGSHREILSAPYAAVGCPDPGLLRGEVGAGNGSVKVLLQRDWGAAILGFV